MTLHKEGKVIVPVVFFVALAVCVALSMADLPKPFAYFIGGVSALIFLFVLQFFRSPHIRVEKNLKHVLAPADGKVVVAEIAHEEEYLNEKRIQISIFMSPVNVHMNRNPVGGTIKYLKYHAGKYLVAWHPKSSTKNERTTLVYEMENGMQILTRQIAGAMARRIKYYVAEGDHVEQGEEFGFIRFGSRVDVFLPLDALVCVTPGDRVVAGKTILAKLF